MDSKTRLRAAVRVFWAARDRRSPESYVGAYAVDDVGWPLRVAIAEPEGGSEAAHLWASFLVRSFCDDQPDSATDFERVLSIQRASFAATLAVRAMEVESTVASDFAGLILNPDGRWRLIVAGRPGFLHLRDDETPKVLAVNLPSDVGLLEALPSPKPASELTGDWLPGDRLVLIGRHATSWLRGKRADEVGYQSLAAFQGRVARAQADGKLAQADVTVASIRTLVRE